MKTEKTILQVEDNINDVWLVSHSLRKAGVPHRIHVATDGQQAIDYLRGSGVYADRLEHPVPDLILLDLKLPQVMGLEVLRWIRKQPGKRIVVIVLTSSALESDIETAYALGANAFLIKPVDLGVLEAMLKAASDFFLAYNTPPEETTSECPSEGAVGVERLGRPRAVFLEAECFP